MDFQKKVFYTFGLLLIIGLLAGCGGTPTEPTTMPTTTSSLVPSPEPTAAAVVETSAISGRVHLMAPPTPAMTVYAMDPESGIWASVGTAAADGEAEFTLQVQPGSYLVFAFSTDASGAYAGYANEEGSDLGRVVIAAGETVSDINVRPPDQAECGSLWGVPPSPDGLFASVSASPDCLMAQATGPYTPVSEDVCLTLQESAAGALSVDFTMETTATFIDPLTGETGAGCTLTATGTGADFSNPSEVVRNLVNGFLGWEEQINYQADGPTGSATALTRDMALLLINVNWEPAPDVVCPTNEPISSCEMQPEQQLYIVQIQVAQN